jgi:hypothetical protein
VTISNGSAAFPALGSLAVGPHNIQVVYTGNGSVPGGAGSFTQVVGKASTTTTVSVKGASLTAVVTPITPGAGSPSGTVAFTVGGRSIGSGTLDGYGTATATNTTASTGVVAAVYSGDGSFNPSSISTAAANPKITAHVKGAHSKSRSGWYRSAVTVSFGCEAGSSPLASACPSPVRLTRSGAGQSVTETIAAVDGGVATVVVSPINIDRVAPTVTVEGVTPGGTYGHSRHVRCVGRDELSGIASCIAHKTHVTHRSYRTYHYVLAATDRAGNVTRSHGSYRVQRSR